MSAVSLCCWVSSNGLPVFSLSLHVLPVVCTCAAWLSWPCASIFVGDCPSPSRVGYCTVASLFEHFVTSFVPSGPKNCLLVCCCCSSAVRLLEAWPVVFPMVRLRQAARRWVWRCLVLGKTGAISSAWWPVAHIACPLSFVGVKCGPVCFRMLSVAAVNIVLPSRVVSMPRVCQPAYNESRSGNAKRACQCVQRRTSSLARRESVPVTQDFMAHRGGTSKNLHYCIPPQCCHPPEPEHRSPRQRSSTSTPSSQIRGTGNSSILLDGSFYSFMSPEPYHLDSLFQSLRHWQITDWLDVTLRDALLGKIWFIAMVSYAKSEGKTPNCSTTRSWMLS